MTKEIQVLLEEARKKFALVADAAQLLREKARLEQAIVILADHVAKLEVENLQLREYARLSNARADQHTAQLMEHFGGLPDTTNPLDVN